MIRIPLAIGAVATIFTLSQPSQAQLSASQATAAAVTPAGQESYADLFADKEACERHRVYRDKQVRTKTGADVTIQVKTAEFDAQGGNWQGCPAKIEQFNAAAEALRVSRDAAKASAATTDDAAAQARMK